MPSSVVLPAPFAPSRPVTPRCTVNEAPSSAVVVPHLLTTPCPLMMVSALMRCRSYGPGEATRPHRPCFAARAGSGAGDSDRLTRPDSRDALRARRGDEAAGTGDDPCG